MTLETRGDLFVPFNLFMGLEDINQAAFFTLTHSQEWITMT